MRTEAATSESLRDRNKRLTAQAIIRAALTLYQGHDYDAVTVEQICEKAEISRATFFNYFAQKDLIPLEIARMRINVLDGWMQQHFAENSRLDLDELLGLFKQFAEQNTEFAGAFPKIFPRMMSNPNTLMLFGQLISRGRQLLVTIIETMQAEGTIRRHAYPELLAGAVWAVYIGTLVELSRPDTEPGAMPALLESRLRILLDPQDVSPSDTAERQP